jgi:hypothetical protein
MPTKNPLDKPLEEAVLEAIALELTAGNVFVLDRFDLARRAAMEGFLQGIALAEKILGEMAADHEHAGERDKAALLHEAAEQVRTLPEDLP